MALFELLAKIRIDGAEQARKHLEGVRDAAHTAAGAISSRLGSAVRDTGQNLARTAAQAGALSTALSGVVGAGAFQAAAKMDSLTRALAGVSTNAADLQGQLNRLREVAKLPGLGFEEAVAGSVALQSAGYSAQLAERSLMAFGNALAGAGKGKDDLSGVSLALQQIASKGKISAEEIGQLRERVPQIGEAMQRAFGTADSEQLQKMGLSFTQFVTGIVGQLEKLPRITGGIQNDIENMQQGIKEALVPLGKGIADFFGGLGDPTQTILDKFKKVGTQIGEVFSAIGKSGVINEVFTSLQTRFSGVFGSGSGLQQGIARFAGVTLSLLKNLPQTISEIGEYIKTLFATIWANIKTISEWGWQSLGKLASGGISALFGGMGGGGGGMIDALGSLFGGKGKDGGGGKVMKGGITDSFSDFLAYLFLGKGQDELMEKAKKTNDDALGRFLGELLGVNINKPTPKITAPTEEKKGGLPDLKKLPSFSKFLAGLSDPMADADKFTAQILGSLVPYSEIPDGLPYGGPKGGSMGGSAGSVFAEWDKNLAAIEKNTRSTADALSARRFGGGELARMGVSDFELTNRPDPYTRSLDSSLRSAIHRAVRADQRGTNRRQMLFTR